MSDICLRFLYHIPNLSHGKWQNNKVLIISSLSAITSHLSYDTTLKKIPENTFRLKHPVI